MNFSNDPVRIKITLKDLWKLTHSPGINSCAHPSGDDRPDEYFLKLNASSINPWAPWEEKYKEDIERELSKFNIIQDHVREFKPYTYFNNDVNSVRSIETILDEKLFSKENRYDLLLDKYAKNWHYLEDGKTRFGMIEGLPCNDINNHTNNSLKEKEEE